MSGFVPPPYPYDRLRELEPLAEDHPGGMVDLSIGTPTDPPAPSVLAALAGSGAERGYPPSVGTPSLREAVAAWFERSHGLQVPVGSIAATIGTKEFVAGVPHWLRLREPERDTVLYPAISYPTYAMGAQLAGARAVAVPMGDDWSLDIESVAEQDAARALCLWVNSPGNPAGGLDDLEALAEWGRARGVPVLSDECYEALTWRASPSTVLSSGPLGVLAVHSASKRSNLAGLRVGFYAGDPDLVDYLSEVRKHAGFMVPGPSQAAAAAAWSDDRHVDAQRELYRERLARLLAILGSLGLEAGMPGGSFYLWVRAPTGNGWDLARYLAERVGMLVSPGEFYGPDGAAFVRVAAVGGDQALELLEKRAGAEST